MINHAVTIVYATTLSADTTVYVRISGEADIATSRHIVTSIRAAIQASVITLKMAMFVCVTQAGRDRTVQRRLRRARITRA